MTVLVVSVEKFVELQTRRQRAFEAWNRRRKLLGFWPLDHKARARLHAREEASIRRGQHLRRVRHDGERSAA